MHWNRHWLRGTLATALAVVALACGTSEPAPTEWDDAVKEIEQGEVAKPIGEIVAGSAFNPMLPDDGHKGHTRVFTQEKEGYAEAEYKLDGQTVVTISVSDTRDNPDARDKFATATDKLGPHPVMERGNNSSLALVADRFQVRASSQTLAAEQRREWLSATKLDQIATLH